MHMRPSVSQNHLCNAIFLGNLVDTPLIRYQANPVLAIAEFTLATHSKWYDKSTKKYKEWTSFHVVKVIGDVVERSLIHAQKGDVILIRGHLLNSKNQNREIIHATYAETYPKGFARSINQVHFSGQINSEIKFVKTENNKELAEFILISKFYVHSPNSQELKHIEIERPIHVWGTQAAYINEHAQLGSSIVIEGKLNYLNNSNKSQFIDCHQAILLK